MRSKDNSAATAGGASRGLRLRYAPGLRNGAARRPRAKRYRGAEADSAPDPLVGIKTKGVGGFRAGQNYQDIRRGQADDVLCASREVGSPIDLDWDGGVGGWGGVGDYEAGSEMGRYLVNYDGA